MKLKGPHTRVCESKGKQLVRANERRDNGDELVTTKSRTRSQCIRPCKCVITCYLNGKESVVHNSNGPLILDNSNYNVSGETESFKMNVLR